PHSPPRPSPAPRPHRYPPRYPPRRCTGSCGTPARLAALGEELSPSGSFLFLRSAVVLVPPATASQHGPPPHAATPRQPRFPACSRREYNRATSAARRRGENRRPRDPLHEPPSPVWSFRSRWYLARAPPPTQRPSFHVWRRCADTECFRKSPSRCRKTDTL